jgi:predicted Ser/Thr protein kinase
MSFQTRIQELLSMHDRLHEGHVDSTKSVGTASDSVDGVLAKLNSLDRYLSPETVDAVDVKKTPLPSRNNLYPQVQGYRIQRELGRGGMGVVYLAEQISLNRLVALKMLTVGAGSDEAEARIRQEAAALAKVAHPNIVSVYEVGQADGLTYFALEYLAGGSLADRIPTSAYTPKAAAELLRTLAIAMHAIHEQGLLHCDLKPANVLLSEAGTPKVADFGLARLMNDDQRQTRTGTLRGTPCYMPPEQADGLFATFGPALDVYSLGGILYEMLTGRPPFLGATILETLDQVRGKDPVSIRALQPSVPLDLETICLKCLAKRPDQRYTTAAELAEELTRFLEHRPISARRPGPIERGTRWCRRNPSRAALLAVCFAGMLGAIIASGWVNSRLNEDLTRMQAARDEARDNAKATQRALVHQAADRIDGEMREMAVRPLSIAAAMETNPTIDESYYLEWLAKLVASDDCIHGLCLAMEPTGGKGFALLVQRAPSGIVIHRRMDKEWLNPPYYERDWFKNNHNVWSEPYQGSDAARTPMVSFTTPIRKGEKIIGVVVLDIALNRLQSLKAELRDLIPDFGERSVLTTPKGIFLYHHETGRAFPSPHEANTEPEPAGTKAWDATLPTTKWKLSVTFPADTK